MKKTIMLRWIILIVFAVFCIAIGASMTELSDMAEIGGISIDRNEKTGQFVFGFEVAQTDKGEMTDIKSEICSVTADTLPAALEAAVRIYPKVLQCNATSLIVISRTVAGEHMSEICRMLLQDWQGDPHVELVVTVGEETALSLLQSEEKENLRSDTLSDQIKNARKAKQVTTPDAIRFADCYLDQRSCALPQVAKTKNGYRIVGIYAPKEVRYAG